jgi:phage major head subunit gpT-like protein
MEITQSNLDIIFRGVDLRYQSAFDLTPNVSDKIAMTIPAKGRQVTFAFMDRLPRLRKWLGDRQVNAAYSHQRSVTIAPFESTLALDKWDVKDDQFGLFNASVDMLGQEAKKWVDDLVFDFIKTGATSDLSYDGVPLYSTSHPVNGGGVTTGFGTGTQSNLFTTRALTPDNYAYVRAQMMSWVGVDGHPINTMPTALIVPPNLETAARQILTADFLPNAAGTAPQSNIWKGTAELIVVQELAAYPNNWWMADLSKPIKPFVVHMADAPTITSLTSPTDANVFMAHQFLYGVEARGAATESLWFLTAAATSEAAYIPA